MRSVGRISRLASPSVLVTTILLSSCSYRASLHKYELQDGYYKYREAGGPTQKVYLSVEHDTIHIYKDDKPLDVKSGVNQYFHHGTYDFDVLTIPFKYRPSSQGFPRQLTAEANGSIFFGWRVDRFKIGHELTPGGMRKYKLHKGVAIGGFGGVGAAAITPWTTNYRTQDEYAGFILTRGVAVLAGVNHLTFGLGVGWDYLTDRDKGIWIYQNKPWLGITIGINLN